MTRKDYELIAKVIAGELTLLNTKIENGEDVGYDVSLHQKWCVTTLANSLAEELKHNNPRFNNDTFLKACGL